MTTHKVTLFIDIDQLTQDALGYLGDLVEVKPYTSFFDYLKELPTSLELDDKSVGA